MDSVSDRDYLIELLSALSTIAMHLSRFSEEIIIWNTNEYRFVEIDDAYSTGSGLLAEHLSPANVVTIPLADKDPVRLGWIYPQNAKLSSHAEEFVRLLEQSIQRSIAYTSSLHRQIVGK